MNDPMFFTEHVLSSGLRVFFQPRNLRWFGASLVVGCGQRNDPVGKGELSHLLEHCLSSGTQGLHYKGLTELRRWIGQQGFEADLGATSTDYSCYGGKSPVEKAQAFFSFLHALVLKPSLKAGLDHEREIIRNERRESTTPRKRRIIGARNRAVYGSHKLATALDWADDKTLDGLTLGDVRAMHRKFYDCPNMTLIVVGGLEKDALMAMLEGIFVPGREGFIAPPKAEPIVFAPPSPREKIWKKPGQVSSMAVAYHWHMPPVRRAVLTIARNVINELLFDRVREEARQAYDIDADNEPYQDHESISIIADVSPKKVGNVRKIIERTLVDLDAAAKEVPRIKEDFLLSAGFQELNVAQTLDKATTMVSITGCPRTIAYAIAEFEKVTPEEVRDLIAERLSPDKAYIELVEQ